MAEEIVKTVTTKPTLDDVVDVKSFEEDDTPHHRRRGRKKIKLDLKCPLCESGVKFVTYKDVYQLKKFTSVRGKIIITEKSGVCAKHQRQLTRSIKRARFMALLPYMAVDA